MATAKSKALAGKVESEDTDRQFVAALARGLNVLSHFTATREELGSAQIAQLTGLPQPTAWRLCYTMSKTGHLVQVAGTDKFRVGPVAMRLGFAVLASVDRRQLVQGEMQELARLSNFAVSLAVAEGHDMLIVQRAIPDSMLILNLHVGSRLPIANSAMGWAYLAGLPKGERTRNMQRLGAAVTKTMRGEISRAVDFYQQHGYVANEGHFHRDVIAIAVPIIAPDGHCSMALNCGGPMTGMSMTRLQREVAPRLLALARLIGETLLPGDDAVSSRD